MLGSYNYHWFPKATTLLEEDRISLVQRERLSSIESLVCLGETKLVLTVKF